MKRLWPAVLLAAQAVPPAIRAAAWLVAAFEQRGFTVPVNRQESRRWWSRRWRRS